MKDMTEIRNHTSDQGWGIENNSLVDDKLRYILRHHWNEQLVVRSIRKSSSTKLLFEATVQRSMPPQYPGMAWVNKTIEIHGEMILSASFVWTQSATPALEMVTRARVYYVEK